MGAAISGIAGSGRSRRQGAAHTLAMAWRIEAKKSCDSSILCVSTAHRVAPLTTSVPDMAWHHAQRDSTSALSVPACVGG
eukprot:878164-Rhodomonas_salina.1